MKTRQPSARRYCFDYFKNMKTFESFKIPEERKTETSFDFTAQDVLVALRSPKKHIKYVGSAISDFQAEPLIFDAEGKPQIFSDWELEIAKNIEGKPSKIKGKQQASEFPKFLSKKELYLKRSKELGENMFRFSLDFGRLSPKEGEFNQQLMAEYVKALALIRANGQEPMLAIYHWPMPKYLLEMNASGEIKAGGWEHPEVAKHFRFYVESVINFLANEDKIKIALKEEGFNKEAQDKFLAEGLVKYFLSINEPINLILPTYIAGIFPPFKIGRVDLVKKVLEKLVEAHDIARNEIKTGKLKLERGEPQVGIAHNWTYFDGIIGDLAHYFVNKQLTRTFERGGEQTDFLGLQHYFRMTLPLFSKGGKVYGEHPAFGDIYPPGIYEVLKKMNNEYPNKEIFITEFGFSDKNDVRRPYWILETVRYVIEALKNNIPVKGMLLWSLVNNFEWNLGMNQKFGLFEESELSIALKTSPGGKIRGWEAWSAVTKAITNPSLENLQELQNYYEKAKQQFENNLTKVGLESK